MFLGQNGNSQPSLRLPGMTFALEPCFWHRQCVGSGLGGSQLLHRLALPGRGAVGGAGAAPGHRLITWLVRSRSQASCLGHRLRNLQKVTHGSKLVMFPL